MSWPHGTPRWVPLDPPLLQGAGVGAKFPENQREIGSLTRFDGLIMSPESYLGSLFKGTRTPCGLPTLSLHLHPLSSGLQLHSLIWPLECSTFLPDTGPLHMLFLLPGSLPPGTTPSSAHEHHSAFCSQLRLTAPVPTSWNAPHPLQGIFSAPGTFAGDM